MKKRTHERTVKDKSKIERISIEIELLMLIHKNYVLLLIQMWYKNISNIKIQGGHTMHITYEAREVWESEEF